MTPELALHHRVRGLRGRLRLLVLQRWLIIGLAAGLAAAAILAALTQLRWWPNAADWLWLAIVVGAAAGLLVGLMQRLSSLDTARIADDRLDLKDRLSSAYAFSQRPARDALMEAQIADTIQRTQALRIPDVFPWKLPPEWRWALAAGAMLLAVQFLPQMPALHSKQSRAEQQAMKKAGVKAKLIAKELEKQEFADQTDAEIAKQIAKNLKNLGRAQEKNRISKKKALLGMNDLMKQLKQLENKLSPNESGRSLQEVAGRLRDSARRAGARGKDGRASPVSEQDLAAMAKALEGKDLKAAQRQLERLAKKLKSGQMTPSEAEAAAKTLAEMAKAMQGSSLENASKELQKAAQALQQSAQQARQLQQQLQKATSSQQRQQIQQQIQSALQQGALKAAGQTGKAGASSGKTAQSQQSAQSVGKVAKALQSAQQSMAQAGQGKQ